MTLRSFGRPELAVSRPEPAAGRPELVLVQGPRGILARVRLTEFWDKMRGQFGEVYADSVAKDHVLSSLGSRTVNQALADGEDVKVIWRAVCEAFRIPERRR